MPLVPGVITHLSVGRGTWVGGILWPRAPHKDSLELNRKFSPEARAPRGWESEQWGWVRVPEHTETGKGRQMLQANGRAAAVPCLALPARCPRSWCSVSA